MPNQSKTHFEEFCRKEHGRGALMRSADLPDKSGRKWRACAQGRRENRTLLAHLALFCVL